MLNTRIRPPVFALSALFACSGAVAQLSMPQLPRLPLRETPRILGRPIERIIVPKDIYIAMLPGDRSQHDVLESIPRGQMIAASEDAQGVFYQAAKGLRKFNFYDVGNPINVPGGLYLSKTRASIIYPYFGDGRNAGPTLSKYLRPLPREALEKLQIGQLIPHNR